MKTNILKKIAAIALMLGASYFSCTKNVEFEELEAIELHSVLKSDIEREFYYTDKGDKVYFNIRKDRVILKTRNEADAKALSEHEVFIFAYDVSYIWVIGYIDPQKTSLDDLIKIPEVVDATYGLEYADGTLIYPSHQISVKGKDDNHPENILKDDALYENVVAIDLFDSYSEIYLITLNVKLSDILSICRDMFESDLYICAAPTSFREMKPHNTLYGAQWGLRNVGQNVGTPDIDIKAEQAWNFTTGNTGVRVAVLDEGVQLDHPDLQANLITGADFTVNSPGGANGSPWLGGNNSHGTACAGVIAAVDNAEGIKGVAPNVRIVPVRIAWQIPGATGWTSHDTWVANGINHAWQTANVDVLNNSWSGPWEPLTNAAINNAVLNGRVRNGIPLGCVVVASSGNNNMGTVSFPASHADVIAVGAINRNGLRWNAGVYNGSNYGNALNVVAPGVDIWTTILSQLGNYSAGTGTSLAAPHVAGIAALSLSYNPNLRHDHVAAFIYQSCTKLPGYTYINDSNHPYSTWNSQVGHGLVSALDALIRVPSPNQSYTISGAATLCGSSIYTLSGGASGNWSVTTGFQIVGASTNVNSVTVRPTIFNGQTGAVIATVNGSPLHLGITECGVSISGPNVVQCSPNSTYTIPSQNGTVSWVVSPGLHVVSQNQTSVTVRAGSSTPPPTGTITARLNGNDIAEKTVTIIAPALIAVTPEEESTSTGGFIHFNSGPTMPGTYEWRVTPDYGTSINSHTHYCTVTFQYAGEYIVECRIITVCGTSPWLGATVNVY